MDNSEKHTCLAFPLIQTEHCQNINLKIFHSMCYFSNVYTESMVCIRQTNVNNYNFFTTLQSCLGALSTAGKNGTDHFT